MCAGVKICCRRAAAVARSEQSRSTRRPSDAALPGGEVVRVEKRFTFDGDRRSPAVGLGVAVENRSSAPVRFDLLAVEWAIMLLGGGGNTAAYYEIDGERQAHDGSGELAGATLIRSGNTYIGIDVATTFDPAATAWWTPQFRRSRTPNTASSGSTRAARSWESGRSSWRPASAARSRVGQQVDERPTGIKTPPIDPGNPSARGLRSTG